MLIQNGQSFILNMVVEKSHPLGRTNFLIFSNEHSVEQTLAVNTENTFIILGFLV